MFVYKYIQIIGLLKLLTCFQNAELQIKSTTMHDKMAFNILALQSATDLKFYYSLIKFFMCILLL